jgi:hypothetical protein
MGSTISAGYIVEIVFKIYAKLQELKTLSAKKEILTHILQTNRLFVALLYPNRK